MGEWNGLQKSPVLSDTICVSPWENTERGSVVLHLPCDSEPSPVGLQPKMGALQKWGIWSAQVISFLLTTVQCSMQFLCLTCCPPRVLFAKKTPNKHTHTPRTVSRRWKQLGATRPGPLNSQGQRLAHPVLSWHIGLTFVVLHNWLGYATRLALKKNVYVLNISYLVSLSNLLFAVFFFFFCSNKELWNIYYLSSTSGCKIRWTLRQPLWEYCVWTRASEALWFIRYLASTGAPVLPRHSWSQIFIIHL